MTLAGFIAIWLSGGLGLVSFSALINREWLNAVFYGVLCLFAATCGVAFELMTEIVAYVEAAR